MRAKTGGAHPRIPAYAIARLGEDGVARLVAHVRDNELGRPAFHRSGPFVWIEGSSWRARLGSTTRCALRGDGTPFMFQGVDGLGDLAAAVDVDLVASAHVIIELLRELDEEVLETAERVQALAQTASSAFATPMTAAVIEQFEPPHFEERSFVFFVVVGRDVVRAAIDVDSCVVRREVIGHMPIPRVIRGRAYVDIDGADRQAQLVPAAQACADADDGSDDHESVEEAARRVLALMSRGAPLAELAAALQAAIKRVSASRRDDE